MAESKEDKAARKVFISYGREPEVSDFVKKLKKDLEAKGYTVWLDVESIHSGSDWRGAIGTGVHKCASFIPIITQKYVKSDYCKNELYAADRGKKCIFPIIYQEVDWDSSEGGRAVNLIVNGINWSMFRPGQDDYSESLKCLVDGMKESRVSADAGDTTDGGIGQNGAKNGHAAANGNGKQQTKPNQSDVVPYLDERDTPMLRSLGVQLGLSYIKLKKVNEENLSQEVAVRWLRKDDNVSETPTWNILVEKLRDVGATGIADRIQAKFIIL